MPATLPTRPKSMPIALALELIPGIALPFILTPLLQTRYGILIPPVFGLGHLYTRDFSLGLSMIPGTLVLFSVCMFIYFMHPQIGIFLLVAAWFGMTWLTVKLTIFRVDKINHTWLQTQAANPEHTPPLA